MNECLSSFTIFEKDVLALFQVEKIKVYLLVGELVLRDVAVDELLGKTEGHELKRIITCLRC